MPVDRSKVRLDSGQARAVVGYCRVSTEEQAREGISLAAQEARIRAYCVANELPLAEVLVDAGGSGKSLQRPALQALLGRLRAGQVSAVVILRLDRLTRRTRDLLALVEDDFRHHQVRLISLSEQLDTQSPAGMMMLTVLGGLAQMERELIGERTKDALAQKRARGDWLGGTPLGCSRASEGGLVLESGPEADAVGFILTARKEGATFRGIAESLRDRGFRTQRGGSWHDSTVRKVWARRTIYENGGRSWSSTTSQMGILSTSASMTVRPG